MPYLGQDLQQSLVDRTRILLLLEIIKSQKLKDEFPCAELRLTRQPYTGDYTLQGKESSAFFTIARFGLLPLPGCHAVAVFYHVGVADMFRGRGIGKELLRVRTEAARKIGYKMVIATVRWDNLIERHLLEEAGWKPDHCFTGVHNGDVLVYLKDLGGE